MVFENSMYELSLFLKKVLGFNFPKEKWKDLERGIQHIMRKEKIETAEACIQFLIEHSLTQDYISFLANYFAIGETYFFREAVCFQALEKTILPQLLNHHQRDRIVRIWSAGCSTGEEIYSLAILLYTLLGLEIKDWRITLLATDLNLKALNHIETGVYSAWSFREVPNGIRDHYFKKIDQRHYQILPNLRKMVTPLYLNLALDNYPSVENNTSAMDIIFCRNVLMYFSQEQAYHCVKRFYDSLVSGGYLVVGSCEYSLLTNMDFKSVNYGGAFFYKKEKESVQSFFTSEQCNHADLFFQSSLIQPHDFSQPVQLSQSFDIDLNAHDLNQPEKNDERENVHYSSEKEEAKSESSVETIESRTRALANQGHLQEALALMNEAIKLDKCNANFRYLKALILEELGCWSEAKLELKNSLYLNHTFALAYFSLGNIARHEGRVAESRKYFSIVLDLIGQFSPNEVLPGSEEITASKMAEIVRRGLK